MYPPVFVTVVLRLAKTVPIFPVLLLSEQIGAIIARNVYEGIALNRK